MCKILVFHKVTDIMKKEMEFVTIQFKKKEGGLLMSKSKTNEEITQHKDFVISNFSSFMDNLIASDSSIESKKADLISYWLKDFQTYLSQETSFDPARIKAYKRGDVIKVNLGFNVGSEQGGLRYAIVLDKDNKHNSKTITVIPLTSIKEEKRIYERDIPLGRELYSRLKSKYDTTSEALKKQTDECNLSIERANALLQFISYTSTQENPSEDDQIKKLKDDLIDTVKKQTQLLTQLQEDTKSLQKINVELHRMKEGSIAKIEQITTISKQRIYDPKKNADVLSGIRFSDAAMDKINEKIKELYIF